MTDRTPFHEGEVAVQDRAGVRGQARRVGGIIEATLAPTTRAFLARQPFVIVGGADGIGRPWASLLTGAPGFLTAPGARTMRVGATPVPGDPLGDGLRPGAALGLLAIDLEARRRVRVNGTVVALEDAGFTLRTAEVFANCPQYIQRRAWRRDAATGDAPRGVTRGAALSPEQAALVAGADTFFITSAHPERGADVSHRGGNPGFVRVADARTLSWPDYRGNNMFQTLGNLAVDPRAGLLFLDFARGDTLQLTGRATVDWDPTRAAAFPGAARVIDLALEAVVAIAGASPLRWRFEDYSPSNPH